MLAKLKKIDEAVYRAERTLVVTALLIMAVVVFLDVVHRGFAGEVSTSWLYGLLIASSGFGFFGIRSAKRAEPVAMPTAALLAVVGVVAAYGLVRALIWVMPNGLIWSQPMALVLTLWVGFIGASMCTYERKHLKVEAVQRFVPDKYKPALGFVSGAMTSLACLALSWLSLRYVLFNYGEYVQTEGRGALVEGWAVPKYQCFAALPIAFTVMTVRFGARAILALQGKVEPPGDALGLPDKPTAALGDLPPSEIATEATPVDEGETP